MATERLLHVHAQESFHDDAYVVGTAAGLRALREAIDRALQGESGRAEVAGVMVADGEGYNVIVLCDDAPWESDSWRLAAVPYTAEHAEETRQHAIYPHQRMVQRA